MDDLTPKARRKACTLCYEKKIKCDYSTELDSCTRCRVQELECVLPTDSEKPSRTSLRQDLASLASRVRHLEDTNIRSTASTSSIWSDNALKPPLRTSISHTFSELSSDTTSTDPSTMSYRAATTPWAALVDHVDTTPALSTSQFKDTVHRLSEQDRRTGRVRPAVSCDILSKFPNLTPDAVINYVKIYAKVAPYPIVHYQSLRNATIRMLETREASCYGELASILIYMAFGTAHAMDVASETTTASEAGLYFDLAWTCLPQLITENSLWSLKALTLMIHYLQASSNPEQCWSLLGTAFRMAVSLGFHQTSTKLDKYSHIEQEEGRRTWWLCYIMEKTFCATFAYPSFGKELDSTHDIGFPSMFQPLAPGDDREEDLATIFGANEVSAVDFFVDMIDLSRKRDTILSSLAMNEASTLDLDASLDQMGTPLVDFMAPSGDLNLRKSIGILAHNDSVQVVAFRFRPTSPPEGRSLASARSSLRIVLETNTKGTTMCLWMWLYYAFTAAVVVFLHTVAEPLDPDTVLDLALLSDLQELCRSMASFSDGAKRVGEIVGMMEKLSFQMMKNAARTNARKRTGEEVESGREKIRRVDDASLEELDGSNDCLQELLGSTPQNLEWDDWDQWLSGVSFFPT